MNTNKLIIKNINNKPNQFEIYDNHKDIQYFQSDNKIIVLVVGDSIFLDSKYWALNKKISRYRNIFLDETTKETNNKINKGIYKLINLN